MRYRLQAPEGRTDVEPTPPFSLSNALVTLAAPVLPDRPGIDEIETAVLAAAGS